MTDGVPRRVGVGQVVALAQSALFQPYILAVNRAQVRVLGFEQYGLHFQLKG